MPNVIRRLAAIDLGTNSFHLVVADVKSNGKFTVIGRDKEVVRLGEGMNDMKRLSEEAVNRAMEALRRFMLIAESFEAPVRAVATSAVREALNRELLLGRAQRELGLTIEVISGFEEARLIYLGVLQALPVYRKRVLLVDIGGGSTEFLVGQSGHVHYINSLKLGAVRLTRRFFHAKQTRPAEIAECRTALIGALDPIRRGMRSMHIDVAIGSSGTILNLASMIYTARGEEILSDANNLTITREDLDAVVQSILNAKTFEQRRQLPGIDPARADIITAGALILEQVFQQLGLREMVTSRYALREGILMDSIRKMVGEERSDAHLSDVRRASVLHLAESCHYEAAHARTVTRMALAMFDQLLPLHELGSEEREFLEAACILHDIGYHISHAQHHRHTYYLVRHSELLGFTDREIEIIANVARYHRKSHPKMKHEGYPRLAGRDKYIVRALASMLRIADGLDRRHKGIFGSIMCTRRDGVMDVALTTRGEVDTSIELWGGERRAGLFEDVFGLRVELRVQPA